MSKKHLLIILILGLASFTMAGCIDLFAVPGIAVSADGTQIYFLGSETSIMDANAESPDIFQFSVAPLGGTATPIMEGFGAFAVNPTSGDVIFSSGLEDEASPQTFLMRYSGGEASLFVGPEAFEGKNFLATQMAYSGDGSRLAMTGLLLPPTEQLSSFSDSDLTPEVIAQFDAAVYLVNVDGGSVTLVSDPNTTWANTLSWSPNGQLLAYNGWMDTNGDGTINTTGGLTSAMESAFSGGTSAAPSTDLSQIFIYDVNSGQTTQVTSTSVSYGAEFVSDSQVAFITLDPSALMLGGGGAISLYDIASGATTSNIFVSSGGLVLGIDRSPDSSQIAWTQLGATDPTTGSGDNELYVSDPSFASPTMVANLGSDFGFVDAPVWLPDGSGVLIASTNIFASLVGGMTAAFSGLSTTLGEDAAAPTEEIPVQQVLLVKVPSGETSTVYTGSMINSNFFASMIGLVGSGDMENMFGDLGQPSQ